jgi:hypothetical protein
LRKYLAILLLFSFSTLAYALDPAVIGLALDYNLSSNPGVTGFKIFALNNDGTHGALVADVPLPSPLPPEDATGFATYTTQVQPDKTGKREFVAIAITNDSTIFSDNSNIAVVIVKPDNPKNLR